MSAYRRKRRLNHNVVLGCIALALIVLNIALFLRRDETDLPAAGVALPAYAEQDYLPLNPYSRPGTPLEHIRGVVIHYVGNPNTSAAANRSYFSSLALTGETYASSHFIVGLEGEVLACVPLTEVAYASNSRNEDTVSIEVCHPDETGAFSSQTYERLTKLTAWLCSTFELDPAEDVIRHYDVTGKVCPKFYVENPEAWEALKADVARKTEPAA